MADVFAEKVTQTGIADVGKVSGVSSANIGTVMSVKFSPAIPIGLMVFLNDTSIPSGWSRVSAADDRMVVAAGSSYAAGATGGSWTTGSIGSGSGGTHIINDHASVTGTSDINSGIAIWWYSSLSTDNGAHSHSFTATYSPNRQKVVIIEADSVQSVFPANTVILANSALTGYNTFGTDNYYAYGSSSLGTVASSSSVGSVSTAGSHTHKYQPANGQNQDASLKTSGSHAGHGVSISASVKSFLLRALTKIAEFTVEDGIIGMWNGASVPDGWTELTTLRDYFLQLNTTGTGTVTGNNTVTGSLTSYSASHDHLIVGAGGSYPTETIFPKVNNTGTYSWSHTHSGGSAAYLAPYWATKFIQYTG